jgi:DNA-binding NtrC family response regulator
VSSAGQSILIVDDDAAVRASVAAVLRARGFAVHEAATAAAGEARYRDGAPELALVDLRLPDGDGLELIAALRRIDDRVPIIMLTGHASVDLAVQAMKQGAEHFLAKPIHPAALHAVIQRVLDTVRDRRRQLAHHARDARHRLDPFVGDHPAIRQLLVHAHQVLDSGASVLIAGETGTGKGVLARWFHDHGPRADEPFVDINCAGLSRELLESELFGHERGSFTGAAHAKLGLFEVAHRGTAFLDEIGEIDLALQPRILKVVEEKRFRRVGDVRTHAVDVRLIAATNRDLGRMVAAGAFRADLYYRINTIHLVIPPLRARPDDLPAIARQVLDHLGVGRPIELSPGALAAMAAYRWPGNLRELRNLLERAVLLSGGATRLEAADLRFEPAADGDGEALTLEAAERRHVERALAAEGGNVDRAAARLGVSRSTLYGKLKRYRDDPSTS